MSRRSIIVSLCKEIGSINIHNTCIISKHIKTFTGCTLINPKDSEKILGSSFNCVVLDNIESILPSDIAKCIGTLKGGGLLIILLKKVPKKIYTRRLIERLTLYDFVYYFNGKDLSPFDYCTLHKESISSKVDIHYTVLKDLLSDYKPDITMSSEQESIHTSIVHLLKEDISHSVILSPRGCGKSTLLGMCLLSHIQSYDNQTISLLSIDLRSVQIIFKWLMKSIEEHKSIKCGDMVSELHYRSSSIKFYRGEVPVSSDIVIVDEASTLPIAYLKTLMKIHSKVILSTTVEGYEGSGRAFSLNFLKQLNTVNIFHLTLPLRFTYDGVYKWIEDCMVLNPYCTPLEDTSIEKCEIFKINKASLFLNRDLESLLKCITYIYSNHYRTSPNDLQRVADLDSHHLLIVLSNKSIVGVLTLSDDGGRSKEGNLISNTLIGKWNCGYRIMRIAVHPELIGKGYGTWMINTLYSNIKGGVQFSTYPPGDIYTFKTRAWLGVSFGINVQLMNFWIKNGFVPVWLKTCTTNTTGEYSSIFIKELQPSSIDIVQRQIDFNTRLTGVIPLYYKDLPLEILKSLLLRFNNFTIHSKNIYRDLLSKDEHCRVEEYIYSTGNFTTVSDVFIQLSMFYFKYLQVLNLSSIEKQVLLLIGLQYKSLKEVLNILTIDDLLLEQVIKGILSKFIK